MIEEVIASDPSAARVPIASNGPNRRGFLRGVAAGIAAASTASLPSAARAAGLSALATTTDSDAARIKAAEKIRTDMAKLASKRPQPAHPTNGEEALYPNRIASYSKGLPQTRSARWTPNAYNALVKATIRSPFALAKSSRWTSSRCRSRLTTSPSRFT